MEQDWGFPTLIRFFSRPKVTSLRKQFAARRLLSDHLAPLARKHVDSARGCLVQFLVLSPRKHGNRRDTTRTQNSVFGIRNLRKPRELSQPNQLNMVGERGFEPPTPWSRTRCSTRLSHSPTALRAATGTHHPPVHVYFSIGTQIITSARRAALLPRRHLSRYTDGAPNSHASSAHAI